MRRMKVADDSRTSFSGKSTVKVPPCSLRPPDRTSDTAGPLSVKDAFCGKVVLITGATGFVGSVTLEQILRLCPEVARVYLLVRAKAGRSGLERFKALLQTKALFKCYASSTQMLQSTLGRLTVLEGDVHRKDCGLSAADLARLRADVDIVIHSAASISFFEHVHVLLQQNYQATREVAELAASMRRLQAFVYVSTCYVNAHRPKGSHIEEAIYPLILRSSGQALQHADLAAKLAQMTPARAERAAQAILRDVGLPNSYTLTKHMAEDLVADMHAAGLLPAAILRPSIIGCIARAPVPGYIGNAAGLTSAILAFASGMARFTCHDPNNVWDLVPCDTVASCILLAAAAVTSEVVLHPHVPLILHAATSTTHPHAYHELFEHHVLPFWQQNPPRHRLSNKPYKSIWDRNAVLREESLKFQSFRVSIALQWLVWRQGLRLRGVALGLGMAGQSKLAERIVSGWRVWKLYNTRCMDFHLFFCCASVKRLAALLPEEEGIALRPLWQAPDDSWADYTCVYMTAIRKKFYAAYDKPDGEEPARLGKEGEAAGEAAAAPPPLLIREDTAFISPADVNVPPLRIPS